jgi:pyruvate-ferredoxin/flavodoxin oxidoreductase
VGTVTFITIDGNEAVASVAHRVSEVIAIYPITPSSLMGELADEWSAAGKTNVWGQVPRVMEMQSEAGAAGAVHGAVQAGSLATTFTASQGLLLMIPNMYKIAGELTPFCMHVAARTVATHALSIFGDHSDVMACRSTGFAMLASGSAQEAHDLAAVAHAATLRSRVPMLHFFDGFRTSHEVSKIAPLGDDDLRALLDDGAIAAHRRRGLSPDHPVVRGTAQNPDAFFQAREACNPFYDACAGIVQTAMDALAARTGRRYHLFDYVGHPEAERVVVMMGSGAETAQETVEWLSARGERVGLVKVRLYRPFDVGAFVAALPATTRSLAVLDRTKEPGAIGEPLYLDVVAALREAARDVPVVVGGRYGLSSKEFTPAMVKGVFDALGDPKPPNHFTVGIVDDVTHRSLPWDAELDIEPDDVARAVLFGLGSDGTVGQSKQSIKIVGEHTERHVQGYFVYDSKKSGSMTISHLRISPRPIRSTYLVRTARFVSCSEPSLLERVDVLGCAAPGATFLLNTSHPPDTAFAELPREVQQAIIDKKLRFFVVDAFRVARDVGLDRRISAIMQTCFFALSGAMPDGSAEGGTIELVREAVTKAYKKRGPEVVRKNLEAIDAALDHMHEVRVPEQPVGDRRRPPIVPREAPDFVQRVTAVMLAGNGDKLPVSAFPVDGTWPTGTSQWEKRGIALEIPIWDPKICIQCNKCSFVCPHAAIRTKAFEPGELEGAPEGFRSLDYKGRDLGTAPSGATWKYAVQVAPDDCTGCGLCVAVCPAKDKSNPRHKSIDMQPVEPNRDRERAGFAFFSKLHDPERARVHLDVKGSQFLPPLFEFSGACAGCGETPYVKLLTQLFGDRMLIANATGCSSIYGGNLPTTPYRTGPDGRGPAWANSLFEDNAEFGMGIRLGSGAREAAARLLLQRLAPRLDGVLVEGLLGGAQKDEVGIAAQRARVLALRKVLESVQDPDARRLELVADDLVDRSIWIVGGDGWAYDIGFGGLDHVLGSNVDVNVLVLDTEVYSNTGGQQSKATPIGASAKFAVAGKEIAKKDLGLIAMSYGHVYVASIAFGAKDVHTVKALQEAASFPGPSIVIAYSPCIAHGYDLVHGVDQQKLAVDSGIWPLYRFDPRRLASGEPPLSLDSGPIKAKVRDFMANEARFRSVALLDPKRHAELVKSAERFARDRRAIYEQLAGLRVPVNTAATGDAE